MENLIKLVARFEGYSATAYKCPAGIWTIGYGSTFLADSSRVKEGDIITEEAALQLLRGVLIQFQHSLLKLVTCELNENQTAAVTSLVYNIGVNAFAKSTLLKLLNKEQYEEAALEFLKWTRGGGKVLPGLVRRRHAEKELFESHI